MFMTLRNIPGLARVLGAVVAGVLLAGSGVARAQDAASDVEYRFVLRLAQENFMEEAQQVAEKIFTGTQLSLVKAQILKISGDAMSSKPEIQEQRYREALQGLNEFLAANPSDAKVNKAKYDKGSILQSLGQLKSRLIQNEPNPSRRQELIQEANTILGEAVTMFEEMQKSISEQLSGLKSDDAAARELHEDRANALYYLGRTYYFLGLCYPPGDSNRNDNFKKGLNFLEEFQWDYGNYTQVLNVFKVQGQIQEAQEKWGPAASSYNSCLVKLNGVEEGEETKQYFNDALRALRDEMVWRVSDMYNRSNRAEDVIAITDPWLAKQTMDEDPTKWSLYLQAVSLERAKAMYTLDRQNEAVDLAKQVAATGGYYSSDAIQTLEKWGVRDLDPAIVYLQAKYQNNRGNVQAAQDGLSAVIRAVTAMPDDKAAANALTLLNAAKDLGDSLINKSQDYLAAGMMMKIVMDWHQKVQKAPAYATLGEDEKGNALELAGQCANLRYKAYLNRVDATAKQAKDTALSTSARDEMNRLYPDANRESVIYEGKSLERDAKNFADNEELSPEQRYGPAIEKYRQAYKTYASVSADADNYETALVNGGVALFYAYRAQVSWNDKGGPSDGAARATELREQATQVLLGFIEAAGKGQPKSSNAAAVRPKNVGIATYHLGRLYVETAEDLKSSPAKQKEFYQQAATLLKDFDKNPNAMAEYIPFALYYEVKALVGLNKVADAQERVDLIIRRFDDGKPYKFLSMACYEVSRITEDVKKKAFYMKKWITYRPDQPLTNYFKVAETFYNLGLKLEREIAESPASRAEMQSAFQDAIEIFTMLNERYKEKGDPDSPEVLDTTIRVGLINYRLQKWNDVLTALQPIYDAAEGMMKDLEPKIAKGEFATLSEKQQAETDFSEAGKRVNKIGIETAFAIFKSGNSTRAKEIYTFLIDRVEERSERWWICKYFILLSLWDGGVAEEQSRARAGLKSLKASYPKLGAPYMLDGRPLPELFMELLGKMGEK